MLCTNIQQIVESFLRDEEVKVSESENFVTRVPGAATQVPATPPRPRSRDKSLFFRYSLS